jgi:transposase
MYADMLFMSRHDISDEKWEIIAPLLARKPKDPRGRPPKDDRLLFNATLWILKTGAPWRDLPKEFGPWQTAINALLNGQKWLFGMASS